MTQTRVRQTTCGKLIFVTMMLILTNSFWPTEGLEQPLRMQITPDSCTESCRVVVQAAARPDPVNEQIVIVVRGALASEDEALTKQFNGYQAQTSFLLEEGQHTIAAILYRKDIGVWWRTEAHIFVGDTTPAGSKPADDAEK